MLCGNALFVLLLFAVDVEPRCGTVRASMETNVLISKTPLGKV
jgi:hypothetical protein